MKNYYQNIEKRLQKLNGVVFYEPLDNSEIAEIEKEINSPLPPCFRDFLLTFGFKQDAFNIFQTSKEHFIEEFFFYKDIIPDHIPLKINFEHNQHTFFLNTESEPQIFTADYTDDQLINLTHFSSLTSYIEQEVMKLENGVADKDKEKVKFYELSISQDDLDQVHKIIDNFDFEHISGWVKAFENTRLFEAEEAFFANSTVDITLVRYYTINIALIEIKESVAVSKIDSFIPKLLEQLDKNNIKYDIDESSLLGMI